MFTNRTAYIRRTARDSSRYSKKIEALLCTQGGSRERQTRRKAGTQATRLKLALRAMLVGPPDFTDEKENASRFDESGALRPSRSRRCLRPVERT